MNSESTENILKRVVLNPYQVEFIDSTARYPALIGGVGTGKTMCGIIKGMLLSEKFENNLGLVIRKEFTDLRDSTIKDFEKYTGYKVDSHKEIRLPNDSQIMFRHGAEINVLKNINLGWYYIEQAEEFETMEVFTFLQDRLRRDNVPIRIGFSIANANGHNWLWKNWIDSPPDERFHGIEACTFDNAHNLPQDFIDDLKKMEKTDPAHYRRYVLNSHEDTDIEDKLFSWKLIEFAKSINLVFYDIGAEILAVDVARFGDDKTVFLRLKRARGGWKVKSIKEFQGLDLMQVTGRIVDEISKEKPIVTVVDDVGMGGGVTDRLRELNHDVFAYVGSESALNDKYYKKRSEDLFQLSEAMEGGEVQIPEDRLLEEELSTVVYDFKSDGRKYVISKKEMKKRGFKSPNRVDALSMAYSMTGWARQEDENRKETYDYQKAPEEEYAVPENYEGY